MTATGTALLLIGALAGGFVSGLAGFGTALMTLGIWLYVLPPTSAVQLVLICSIVAQSATLPSMWKRFNLGIIWPFIVGGLAGVPLGTLLIAHANPVSFKLTIGVLLLVFSAALHFNRNLPAIRFGGRTADGAVGSPVAFSAALPGCRGRCRSCGRPCAAGARTNGAASISSTTGRSSSSRSCCSLEAVWSKPR